MWLIYQLLVYATETLDLESHFTLRTMYSMEQEGIPVLTELIDNLNTKLCTTEDTQGSDMYKWPALMPCVYKPTWKRLCLIFESHDKLHLAIAVKSYLEKKKGIYEQDCLQ